MNKQTGLWIDHRKAVIVNMTHDGEEIKEIVSGVEKDVRFTSGDGSEHGSTEDIRDRQFENHLKRFYDEVVVAIRDTDTIQIFGPGEAKAELVKRIERSGLKMQILAIETTDKMTDRQIAAKVREHFPVKTS